MGGNFKLSSRFNQGTTIEFDVPVRVVDANQLPNIISQPGHAVVSLSPGQPQYRILVADDRLESRLLLTRLLTPLGFEVREASNGQEAIAIWETWEPQLILMDMRMPVMGGEEATRRIKTTAKGKDTIIIALTASSFEEEREQILLVGCNDFLRKPFRERDLFEAIHKHLGVEFVYESAVTPSTVQVDASALTAMPIELREQLIAALNNLNVKAIDTTVEAIAAYDASLTESLRLLAKRFEYRRMLALLKGL
jgi:CheY-like chemotaxis protein